MLKNPRPGFKQRLLLALGLVTGLAGVAAYQAGIRPNPPVPSRQSTMRPVQPAQPVQAAPLDKQAVRAKAMSVASARLDAAEGEFATAAAALADKHLATIDEFFAERRKGIRPFSERVLSFKGKWKFVRGQVWKEDEDEHVSFLRSEFEKYVFKPDELNQVVTQAASGYATELAGLENQLLIKLRADLCQSDLAVQVIPSVGSQEKFDTEYRRIVVLVAPLVAKDLRSDVARELASFIAADIAARIAIKVMAAVATRLGISAGILSTGVGSSAVTLGVGVVAAILVDLLLDEILKVAGNDPAGAVADRVNASLAGIKDIIKDGNAEAKADWMELQALASSDPEPEVRAAAAAAVDSIERSGNLGLRRELLKFHEQRSIVRREAVKSLILSEENNQ